MRTPVGNICTNGFDDDKDGFVDSADSDNDGDADCASDDDDGDGDIDEDPAWLGHRRRRHARRLGSRQRAECNLALQR